MSSRWLRNIFLNSDAISLDFTAKLIAAFLEYCLDYTLQTDSCGIGKSFRSTEKSGDSASFSGLDFIFVNTSSFVWPAFVQSDVGKYLIIRDNVHPENAGIYPILRYIDENSVEIDFRSGADEFPTASSGMSYWVFGAGYQLPATDGDYVTYRSRHSTGWAIKVYRHKPVGYSGTAYLITVSVDGVWVNSKIMGTKQPEDTNATDGIGFYCGYGDDYSSLSIEGDYDGEWLHLWRALEGDKTTAPMPTGLGAVQLISIERVTPIELEHVDTELTVIRGPKASSHIESAGGTRSYTKGTYNYTKNFVYSERLGKQLPFEIVDFAYNNLTSDQLTFARTLLPESNRRLEEDGMPCMQGSLIMIDVDNEYNAYEILGVMNGHLSSNCFRYDLYDNAWLDEYFHRRVPLNMGGTRNKLLVTDGIIVDWPGYSTV